MKKIIQQGAEAVIIYDEGKGLIFKDRSKKDYRIPELDEKIRKSRTKSEVKILLKASKVIDVPVPLEEHSKINDFRIAMPFIKGEKISESLDNFSLEKQKQICRKMGEQVAGLHDSKIIHGDLTTSNMIYVNSKKGFRIYFIDFGLGFISHKVEDKAVDIYLLKGALESRHFKNWKKLFEEFIKGYKKLPSSGEVLERLKEVENRRRYKEKS